MKVEWREPFHLEHSRSICSGPILGASRSIPIGLVATIPIGRVSTNETPTLGPDSLTRRINSPGQKDGRAWARRTDPAVGSTRRVKRKNVSMQLSAFQQLLHSYSYWNGPTIPIGGVRLQTIVELERCNRRRIDLLVVNSDQTDPFVYIPICLHHARLGRGTLD